MRQKRDDEDEFEMRSGASNKPDGSSGAGSCRAPSFVSRLGCRSEIFLGVLWEQNNFTLYSYFARACERRKNKRLREDENAFESCKVDAVEQW